jgi:hypothetical protein
MTLFVSSEAREMNSNEKSISKLLAIMMVLAILFANIPSASASQEQYYHWLDKAPGSWSNTTIQKTNSAYFEDEVIPHYFTSKNLTPGLTYAFNIVYDYYEVGKDGCGFHYLAQYDTSRTTTFVAGTPTINAALPEGHGNFFTVGANITNVSNPVDISPQRYVQVTFTATAATAEFYWGLYLSPPEILNGTCTGASDWPGASVQSDVKATPVVPGAIIMVGGGGSAQAQPSAITRGSISGMKWNDLNGNGAKDTGEPGLPGWTIQLCADSACTNVVLTTTTDAGGAYTFVKFPGAYYVREVEQTGWTRTFPSSVSGIQGPYTISIATPTHTGVDFGNWQPPTAVTVSQLSASAVNQTIWVSWETYSEEKMVSFNLYRTIAGGERALVYQTPASHPGMLLGEAYAYSDAEVQQGVTYTYWLDVLLNDGSTTTLGPASANLPNVAFKVFLPSVRR